jgi:hypothetical protein
MAITLPSGFNITNNEPGDGRVIVANQSARLGFSAANVYKGMLVFQQDTQELYTLIDNASPTVNSSWVKLVTAGTTNQYSGSFSGSFQGNGAGLTNLPASSIVGLNLTQIADSQVSASVSATGTSFTITSASVNLLTVNNQGLVSATRFTGSFGGLGSGSFSGSFQGNGNGLTNIPAASIVGLNLSLVSTGSVTASTAPNGTVFQITSGSSTLLSLNSAGDLTVSASEFIGNNISAVGSATITGSLTVNGVTTLNNSLSVTNTFTVGNSSSLQNTTVTGSLLVTQNLTVLGTASFTQVTSSEIIIGASTITLNTDDPVVRYGGLIVIDSGSFGIQSTGSLLWDSERNHWIYGNPSGSSYDGGGIMSGPRNTAGLGNETYPIRFSVLRGQGGDHLEDSNIYSTGSYVTINKGGTGSKIAEVDIFGSVVITGSTLIGSPDGAVTNKYALVTSQSAWHYNSNVGYPTSNNWQAGLQGSYFNNFTANSDVSEMLRFIAGLLSASAPDASPNTKTYANISETITNNGTGTPAAGNVPQSSSEANIRYWLLKGFTATGSTLFPGKTVYNNSSYNIVYNSVAGGSTIVSSSADSELFGLGLLTSGGPTQFNVSGASNWFFSDNNNETVTAVSGSQRLLSNSAFGTTSGLTLARINTINPAVIPPAYQDGKFAGIFSSGLFNGGVALTNISSSGWYHISASIRIASGSSPYTAAQSITERIFYVPLPSISIANNTKAVGYAGFQALTATSRSLSGAPYLTAATWGVSSSVSGLFNPMYSINTTIARQGATGNVSLTNGGTGAFQATINANAQISSADTVYDSTGVTVRATSTIPFETDLIRLTGSISLSIGTGTNIAQSGLSPTTFTIDTFGRDRSGTEGSTLNTQTIPYHSASAFGQPLSSGSMAYYGQAQGFDGGTLTGTSEVFSGESFRVQITNKFLSGSFSAADAWVTTYGLYNLGGLDLQVKPGHLVRPGSGTYGYWITDPDSTKTYKFYARAFQRSSGTAANALTLNLGRTLVAWDSATSGVAVAILFKSSGILNYATPRIYDPTQLTSNLINASIANDNQRNPFTTNIALYGNTGGGLASTTYTVPLREADGMILNGTNQDYIILVRYTGDQVPVSSIAVSYS